MKQTLTVKVLVMSAVALAVASGCERRTRPPAKPDVASDGGGGNNIAGNKTPPTEAPASSTPSAPPSTEPSAPPSTEPSAPPSAAPMTDDQKAIDLHSKLEGYMQAAKEHIEKKTGYISLVDGKDAADKLTVTIDKDAAEAFYKAEVAKLKGEDKATIDRYKSAAKPEPQADDVVAAMVNGLEGKDANSLKSVMEKFKAELSAIKPTVEGNIKAKNADLDRVEAILKSIDDAVKHVNSLK